MEIMRNGSRPSGKGPAANFSGSVRVAPLFPANAPARALGASVTFAIQEELGGKAADWMENVRDEQCQGAPSPR